MKSWRALAAALVMVFLPPCNPFTAGSGPPEEWVSLRVHQSGGDITVEAPRAFIKSLSLSPTGVTIPLGTFKGRPLRISADRLVRMLRDAGPGPKEAVLFTRQTDQGPVTFFAMARQRSLPPRGRNALLLAFDMSRKGAEPTRLVLPLAGSATLGKTLLGASGLQADTDLGPLLEHGIESAKTLGTGPFLKAEGSDAIISLALQ